MARSCYRGAVARSHGSGAFTPGDLAPALADTAVAVLGLLYCAWFLGHMILLRSFPRGEFLVLFAFFVTYMTDSGAYYAGVLMGRRLLAPRVSPKKTVEGAIGGFVAGLFAALVGRGWFLPQLTVRDALVAGALMAVAGQLGDLVESLFKRSAGVKDSGGLIPSHGGLLDKVDSLMFTAPSFYYYLVWVQHYGQVSVI